MKHRSSTVKLEVLNLIVQKLVTMPTPLMKGIPNVFIGCENSEGGSDSNRQSRCGYNISLSNVRALLCNVLVASVCEYMLHETHEFRQLFHYLCIIPAARPRPPRWRYIYPDVARGRVAY